MIWAHLWKAPARWVMGIGWLAVKGIGTVGLVIVCSAVLIVSLLLLVNTPISAFLDHRREKKYQHALDERSGGGEEARNRAREIEEQKAKLREKNGLGFLRQIGRKGAEKRLFSQNLDLKMREWKESCGSGDDGGTRRKRFCFP